jgi:hypothetical protein
MGVDISTKKAFHFGDDRLNFQAEGSVFNPSDLGQVWKLRENLNLIELPTYNNQSSHQLQAFYSSNFMNTLT